MFNGSKLQKFALLLALIFVASAVIAGVIYAVQYGSTGFSAINFNSDSVKGGTNVDEERTEALQGISSISIEGVSEDIKLIPVETDEVKAHFYGNYSSTNADFKPELIVERTGSSLKIKIQYKPNLRVMNYRANLNLDVYIPKQFTDNLELKSTSGDIDADELILESFKYNNVSGNLNVDRINAKKATFVTVSGEVAIEGLFDSFSFDSVSGYLSSDNFESKASNLDTTSGEIKLAGNPGDITATSVSGNLALTYSSFANKIGAVTTSGEVTIKLPENAGFSLDYATISGDADCAFPITVTGNKKGNSLKGTVSSGDGTINVTTVSGNLEIQK